MIRCEIWDEHGEAVVYVDETILDRLTPAQRDTIDELLAPLRADRRLAELTMGSLIPRMHDEAAYARVCADRGLLL